MKQERSLRLLQTVRSELPFPPFMVAKPGIYVPEDIDINQHGAVSVRALNGGWLGVKPNEMEWIGPRERRGE